MELVELVMAGGQRRVGQTVAILPNTSYVLRGWAQTSGKVQLGQ